MLKDELWKIVSPPEEYQSYVDTCRTEGSLGRVPDYLCISCVELRLGRTIYSEDLNNSLWSTAVREIVQRELDRARQ